MLVYVLWIVKLISNVGMDRFKKIDKYILTKDMTQTFHLLQRLAELDRSILNADNAIRAGRILNYLIALIA